MRVSAEARGVRSGQRREAAIERQGLGSERAIADAKGGFGGRGIEGIEDVGGTGSGDRRLRA